MRGARDETLVVADLDGTLTFAGDRPEPVVLAAWDALMALPGVRVALATARSPRCIRGWFGPRVSQIDLVCCNGALVVPAAGRVTSSPLPVRGLHPVVSRLEHLGVGYCLEYGDHFVASTPRALPWMGTRHRRLLPRGLAPRLEGVLKLSVASAEAAHAAVVGVPGLTVLPHATGDGDVLARGVGKEVAVADLRRRGERLVALGNDANDRGLLGAADAAYLVGGGLRDLDLLPHVRRVPAVSDAVAQVLRTVAAHADRRPVTA